MYMQWFGFEFWRFTFLQEDIGKAAQSIIEFPPTQAGASFNLPQWKEELAKKAASHGSE